MGSLTFGVVCTLGATISDAIDVYPGAGFRRSSGLDVIVYGAVEQSVYRHCGLRGRVSLELPWTVQSLIGKRRPRHSSVTIL